MDHRQFDPGLAAVGLRLIVLAQSPAPAQPGEGSLHHPPPLQHFEAWLGPRDDLQADGICRTPSGHPGDHPFVNPVSPYQSQPTEPTPNSREDLLQAVVILNISGVNHDGQNQAHRVDEDVPLAARQPLTAVVAFGPPCSVVRTAWLSRMAAEGCCDRPAAARKSPRSCSCSRSKVPSFAQEPRRKPQFSTWAGELRAAPANSSAGRVNCTTKSARSPFWLVSRILHFPASHPRAITKATGPGLEK